MKHQVGTALAVALLGAPFAAAHAATVTLTRIADTTIDAGDGSKFFTYAGPQMTGANVVFAGRSNNGLVVLLKAPATGGTLLHLLDTNTLVPGGTGAFSGTIGGYFTAFQPAGGCSVAAVGTKSVAFVGHDPTNGYGIYTVPLAGGAVRKIVDPNTTYPDAPVNGQTKFSSFCNVALTDKTVTFDANGGVYSATTTGARLSAVADFNTPATPPPFPVQQFVQPTISGKTEAYVGGTVFGPFGIYAGPTNALGTAIVTSDSFAQGQSQFPVIGGKTVVFSAGASPNFGLYSTSISGGSAGIVTTVADTTSKVPGNSGASFAGFNGANQYSVGSGFTAFIATVHNADNTTGSGLFSACKARRAKLVASGDVLPDGASVRGVFSVSNVETVSVGGVLANRMAVAVDAFGPVEILTVTVSPAC